MGNKIIITILIFTIVLGVGMGLIWPKYQCYKVLKLEVGKKETELVYNQQYFSRLKEIEAQFAKNQESVSKVESALPEYFSVPAFFANLQKMSAQAGLILNQVSKSSTKDNEGVKEHSFSVSVSGTISSFENFILYLENSVKLIDVESFDFSSPTEEDATGEEVLDFNLAIKTYSY